MRASGSASLPGPTGTDGSVVDDAAIVAAIERLVSTLPLSTRRVAIGLGGRDAFITRFSLPRVAGRELGAAVWWEARAHLPFDTEEVALDYHALPDHADPSQMTVVVAATHRSTIDRWRALVARAGLRLARVDVLPFALQRACAWLGLAPATTTVLLLDIGVRDTVACLVRGGHPLVVRDLGMGGDAWSAALAREARCTLGEAEALKLAPPIEDDATSSGTDLAACQRALALTTETFLAALGRTVAFARQHDQVPAPERVVLSGGGARLHGLDVAVATSLGCPLEIFDPSQARHLGDAVSRPELGAGWAIGIGLALPGVWR